MARIILADDDELVGEAVRAILSEAGHIVGVVQDGAAAADAICLKVPHLAILDVSMPGLAGPDVVRRVRSSESAYDIPILMLTARRSEQDVRIAMRAGADDYLKKPFDPDQLIKRVERLLAGRKRKF